MRLKESYLLLLFPLLVVVLVSCSASRIVTVDEMLMLNHWHIENEPGTSSHIQGRIANDTINDVALFTSMRIAPYLEDETLFLVPKGWRLGFDETLIKIECLSPSEDILVSELVDQHGLHPNRISSIFGAIEESPVGTACTPHSGPSDEKPRLLEIVCVEWRADDTDTFRIVKKWDCNWPPLPLEPEEETPEDEKEGSGESGTPDRETTKHVICLREWMQESSPSES